MTKLLPHLLAGSRRIEESEHGPGSQLAISKQVMAVPTKLLSVVGSAGSYFPSRIPSPLSPSGFVIIRYFTPLIEMHSSSTCIATSASSGVTMSGGAIRIVLGPHPRKTPRSNANSIIPVALGWSIFLGLLIFHDFDPNHQAASANVANELVLARPRRHLLQHVISDLGGIAS